jgi:hypothetical protein
MVLSIIQKEYTMNACEMNTRELSDLELNAVSAGKCVYLGHKIIDMGIFGQLEIQSFRGCGNGQKGRTNVNYYPAE